MANVFWSTPPASLFEFFPPNPNPGFVPPPHPGTTTAAPPFSLSDHVYYAALDARVPLTIAAAYAVTVTTLNKYNRSTGKKPWAISQTRGFFWFVVLHNVFLAFYSAWTFWGMLGALRRSVVNPTGPTGLAGTVDSFCRLAGAPGLGNGAFYSDTEQQWLSHSSQTEFTAHGPSRYQTGRIWNEGLSFYGWLFYLSKFYEVLDTFIILAKGKLSSTLQTYHHAGAMMCMWTGMRYMGNPIWVFVTFNSFIHAMMYTYYTITAFSIRVPQLIKRILTSLQISQFVIGASVAMAYSFISYTIPVAVEVAQSSLKATKNFTAPAATRENIIGNLKNVLLGAVAKADVQLDQPSGTNHVATMASSQSAPAVTYTNRVVPCVTTSSETFSIWLNVLYLAPLTYLFVKFFITSYIRRSSAESARIRKTGAGKGRVAAVKESVLEEGRRRLSGTVNLAERAAFDAAKGLEREIYRESHGDDTFAVVEEEEEETEEAVEVPAAPLKAAVASGEAPSFAAVAAGEAHAPETTSALGTPRKSKKGKSKKA